MAVYRMPVLFVGHGSPLNAVESNSFTRGWQAAAASFPKPKAVLCVSAHWLAEGTGVTAMERPKTIHDFYGFPSELYEVSYPAPGAPELARKVAKLVKTVKVSMDLEWGLDHGCWSVLCKMYPKADIPAIQLAIDVTLPLEKYVEIGRQLAPLRNEGALILASGNLVHNLRKMQPEGKPFDWNEEFDAFVKKAIETGDVEALVNYHKQPTASLAHPTNDHYLPLMFALGAAGNDKPSFFSEGLFYSSLSMRSVKWGK